MKTVLSIDCGSRARACAQGLAAAIFNADESDYINVSVGARYAGSKVNLVIDDEDVEKADPEEIIRGVSKAMRLVINAAKNGFDGNSPEEMLEIFSYPDEGTAFYSNVKGKTDLTVADLEFLQAKLTSAIASKTMTIGEAKEILRKAGKTTYVSDAITAVLAVASDRLRRDSDFWDENELAEVVEMERDVDWNVAYSLLWTLEEISRWKELKTDSGRIISPKEAKSIQDFICSLPDEEAINLILDNKPRYYQHFYDQMALALNIAHDK